MPKIVTAVSCIEDLYKRITKENCPSSIGLRPSAFVRNYAAKWELLSIQAGVLNFDVSEVGLKEQYVGIRMHVDRLGYKFHPEGDAAVRFDSLSKSTIAILGRNTKAEYVWSQVFERNPTYLDAYVIMQIWVLNVDAARDHKNHRSALERDTRASQRERDRLESEIIATAKKIAAVQQQIEELAKKLEALNQYREECESQYLNLHVPDSTPQPNK